MTTTTLPWIQRGHVWPPVFKKGRCDVSCSVHFMLLIVTRQTVTASAPSVAVTTSDSPPTLSPARGLHSFFTKTREASQAALSVGSTPVRPSIFTSSNISSLTQPLPVPTVTGLTRSQSLFSILTGINAHALSIKTKDEFFLFMDMREELGWVSYNMTSRRWVLATMNYNSRLEALNSAKNIVTIPKHPRALMEHLGVVETKIASRIARNDFTCTSSFFVLLHRL